MDPRARRLRSRHNVRGPRTGLAALVIGLLLLVGCGTGAPDLGVPLGLPENGATLLEEDVVQPSCASCHTLSGAEWQGTVAPNLDLAQPGYERVLTAIRSGPGAMPSYDGLLSEQQMRDLAAYVSEQAATYEPGGG